MISVVVTNYNYEKFLGRCLRSLLDQTLDPEEFEVILVDDNSSDYSLEVAKPFSENIRIIQCTENVGLASASNLGIRAARGRYIVRVDADDFVHPEFLRFLLRYMELRTNECDAVAVNYWEVDSDGHMMLEKDSELAPIACGIAFKSEVMLRLGLYQDGLRIGEDTDFIFKFNLSGHKLEHLKLPLYRYTKHAKSLTASARFR